MKNRINENDDHKMGKEEEESNCRKKLKRTKIIFKSWRIQGDKPQILLTVFNLLLCSSFPSSILTDSGLKGPPHISGEVIPRYTATVGESIKIDCPIESALQPLYEWSKDGEPITPAWDRFRDIAKKKLRIKNVSPEDGGIITCKGVNGFGNKEVSTRLVVYDDNGDIVSGGDGGGGGGGGGDEDDESTSDEKQELPGGILGIIPKIVEMSRPTSGPTFRQTVGSSLSLYCEVEGQPLPLVSWFKIKDGVEMPKVSGHQQLDLISLTPDDQATYLCRAVNQYGQANASFIVEVFEAGLIGAPLIISLEPSNLTVVQGRPIHYRCHINSDSMPKVQWMRERELNERDGHHHRNTNVDNRSFKQSVPDGKYELINSTMTTTTSSPQVKLMRNGSYVSELIFKTESRDTRSIICLSTNEKGYNFQKSFITILPTPESDSSSMPIGALVAIPSTLAVLFSVLALVICCVRRGQNGESGVAPTVTVTTSTTYATPRDVIHEHSHHHRHQMNGGGVGGGGPVPFYSVRNGSGGQNGNPHNHHHQLLHHNGQAPTTRSIPSHFGNHQYFSKEPSTTLMTASVKTSSHPNSTAYASVPICDNGGCGGPPVHLHGSTFGAPSSRAPPLPVRPNFPPCNRDRTSYNNQGLLTQPLLTQTASSSDSRDSRQSASYGRNNDGPNCNQRQIMDHQWCSSGSDESDKKRSHHHHHQIRL